jgi:hypothetical protein
MEVKVAKQTKPQKETVERVMHEFKEGDLRIRGNGPKVKNPKQAIAIALHEAGATNQESPKNNRENLRKTKAKERQAETAGSRKGATSSRKSAKGTSKGSSRAASKEGTPSPRERLTMGRGAGAERSRAELYTEAKRRDIPGRSRMSKADLERALR